MCRYCTFRNNSSIIRFYNITLRRLPPNEGIRRSILRLSVASRKANTRPLILRLQADSNRLNTRIIANATHMRLRRARNNSKQRYLTTRTRHNRARRIINATSLQHNITLRNRTNIHLQRPLTVIRRLCHHTPHVNSVRISLHYPDVRNILRGLLSGVH